jgi:rare lipoprotein A
MLRLISSVAAAALLIVAACVFVIGIPMRHAAGAEQACHGQTVLASWYGSESGSRTASGLYFDGSQLLVAHRSLPFGTKLRLSYRGRSMVVAVEDRGPFVKGRTLDLSEAVARRLGTKGAGVARVCMVVLAEPKPP